MKILRYIAILIFAFISPEFRAICQESKPELLLSVSYCNDNNHLQYLIAHTKTKQEKRYKSVQGINLKFYINSESDANLMGKATTNENGEAYIQFPPSVRDEWIKSSKPGFIVVSEGTKQFDAGKANFDLTKARLKIDTAEGKKIVATLAEQRDSLWTPVKGVDIRLVVKRLDGDLNVNESPTYTTDSLGTVSADFKIDGIPGDKSGNIVLMAVVDDNDTYGTITAEKRVSWGTPTNFVSEFDKRTLFARRGRSPFWLDFIAYSIIVSVWTVLLYLVLQIRKLKTLGG